MEVVGAAGRSQACAPSGVRFKSFLRILEGGPARCSTGLEIRQVDLFAGSVVSTILWKQTRARLYRTIYSCF